jgi:dolichyl-phosphate-mannose-protein mannosyltransferase
MSLKPALIAACIVAAGFVLRLPGLSDPPLDFHPTRQYFSAVMARGYALDLLGGLEPAARQADEKAARALAPIEPRVMEHLASWVYHLVGREDLAWARALAVIAWSLGGLAIFWLGIQLLTAPAALTAVAVWTFLPFAIRASRSFQPDPLMTALVVFTLAAAVRYNRRPTVFGGILFGCGLAAALTVKAMAVFFLGPALVAIVLLGHGSMRAKAVTTGIAIVALAPAAWYYSRLPLAVDYGPFFQLLAQPAFWRGLAAILDRVVSWPLLMAAVLGAILATGELRRLLLALFAGYIAFGIVFTHHIHTHDYYSLPLVPIVALGVGALVDAIARVVAAPRARVAMAAVIGVCCLAAGVLAVADSRNSARVAALTAEASRYERIGRMVGHSPRVLALDGAYGLPLMYYGHMLTSNWPLSGDSWPVSGNMVIESLIGARRGPAAARLDSSGADFFVCTIQAELDGQPDLKALLEREHALLERDGAPERWAFVVYDLRRGVLSATPNHLSLFARIGAVAPDQMVSLFAPPSSHWTVHVPEGSPLTIQPAEGIGPANLRVTAAVSSSAVDRSEKVTVTSATEGSAAFEVRIRAVAGPDNPPFGFVDAPPDPVTLGRDPILFQGWALDDISMKRVWVEAVDRSGATAVLGDARREGSRPDLTAAYPNASDLQKAGWSYRLDATRVRKGAVPVLLRFVAEDGSGHRAIIGTRTLR